MAGKAKGRGCCGGIIVVLLVGYIALWVFTPMTPRRYEASGDRLLEVGRYREALEAYHAALTLQADPNFVPRRRGSRVSENWVWLSIGECHEELGELEAALSAYVLAANQGRWSPPYIEAGHCIHRLVGLEEAIRWYESRSAETWDDSVLPYLTGSFLVEADERERAKPFLKKALECQQQELDIEFDEEGWLILEGAALSLENNPLVHLIDIVEQRADALLNTGDLDHAYKVATMGVSSGQQLRRLRGDLPRAVEVGNVYCRLVRADVNLSWGKALLASEEIELARREADSFSGWARIIKNLEERLDRLKGETGSPIRAK